MKPQRRHRFAFLIVAALLLPGRASNGQARAPLSRSLVWPAPGEEILTPRFSPDGKFIALVTRAYAPDGADAEGLPDSYFKKLEAQAKADPRFFDPVIKVVSLSGKVVCETQYGWNPSLSRDDKRLVFSAQAKPITGYRTLAAPMSGNTIRMYNCGTKRSTTIAVPSTGSLDTPFFSPDGKSVVYTENAAVNGAYGGSVGIARVDLRQNREVTLVHKKAVPAYLCPSRGPRPPACALLGDSGPKRITGTFARIVDQVSPVGNQVVALLAMPIPTFTDLYLASKYSMSLVSVLPMRQTILSLGERDVGSQNKNTFQGASGERVLIFSTYWKLYSLVTGKLIPSTDPKNTKLKSVYSPDLKYYLCAEPEDYPTHLNLYRAADGKRIAALPRMSAVYDAVWSPESNRFAFVGVPKSGAGATRHREELLIYSVR